MAKHRGTPALLDRSLAELTGLGLARAARPLAPPDLRRWTLRATVVVALVLGMLRLLPWGFETNDDVSMMTAVGGLDGAPPDPVTGFQHVLLGRLLVALGRLLPVVPWYGLLLVVLQAVALLLLLVVLRVAGTGWPRAVVVGSQLVVVGLVVGATVRVQFTIVAILLSGASLLAIVVLGERARRPTGPLVALGALAVVGSFVRFFGFALAAALVLLAAILRLRPSGSPRRAAVAGALLATIALATVLVAVEDGPLSPDRASVERMREELYPPGSRFGATQNAGWRRVAEHLDPGGLSENDLELVRNWILPTPELLGVAAPSVALTGPSQSEVLIEDLRRALASPHRVVLGGATAIGTVPLAAALLLLVVVSAGGGGRTRLVGAAVTAAATVLGLGLIDAVTRLPSRVLEPVVVVGLVAVIVAARAGTAQDAASPSGGTVPAAHRWGGALAALVGILVVLEATVSVRSAATTVASGRDVIEQDVVRIVEVMRPGDVLATWLVDLDRAYDPLAPDPAGVVPVDRVNVSGWPVTLPRTRARWAELGMEDWVDAVATRDDVLLTAGPKKVELLRVHLVERRGWACPEPDGVVELASGDLVVRRFVGREACGR